MNSQTRVRILSELLVSIFQQQGNGLLKSETRVRIPLGTLILGSAGKTPAFRNKVADLGANIVLDTPEVFADYVIRDVEKWKRIIKANKIEQED